MKICLDLKFLAAAGLLLLPQLSVLKSSASAAVALNAPDDAPRSTSIAQQTNPRGLCRCVCANPDGSLLYQNDFSLESGEEGSHLSKLELGHLSMLGTHFFPESTQAECNALTVQGGINCFGYQTDSPRKEEGGKIVACNWHTEGDPYYDYFEDIIDLLLGASIK